ncbi:MAG: 2-dehydro-3-deoxy-D-gluconate 5-dehydrogenase KduD [Oceanospirillaceae bacterium]|nr:2-dehydro-3-deoxy-D-gluconate 5-dehydrogenase KduD [Oceanospirillaceae bacterium]
MQMFDLTGKVAVVTGASKGLGQAMAVALAKAGADIAAVARSSMRETELLVNATGRDFLAIETDLAEHSAAQEVTDRVLNHYSSFDILVNNAGMIRRQDALDFSEDNWDAVMDLNLKSLFFLSQQAARHWIAAEKGGRIINIASMLSYQGGIRVPSYTASKSGVLGITRQCACEWAKHNITVNAIAPGYMRTDNTAALREDGQRNAEILARIPAGRWGEPDDLAAAVIFLASDAACYVQGVSLPVDGGWLAR